MNNKDICCDKPIRSFARVAFLGSAWIALLGCTAITVQETVPIACADLGTLELPDTRITLNELVPAGGFASPVPLLGGATPDFGEVPAFCRVTATVAPVPDSEIKFELWMPAEGWNGKFVGTGNGGLAGVIFHPAMAGPLLRGYAVANSNTGHDGGPADASFAVGHPEKLVDHAWRAVHEMTVKSKAIAAEHYGTPVGRSYWTGCSSGGRQGLKEAQRFPEDYDAIVARAPANNWIPLMTFALLVQQTANTPDGGLPVDKILLLKESAIAACDAKDGVVDSVVVEPQACEFDLAVLECAPGDNDECLLPHEIEVARKIYAGVVNPRTGEQYFPGTELGGESEWQVFAPGIFPIGTNYWRDLIVGDPAWDPSTLNFDTDVTQAIANEIAGLAAVDPDIGEFVERGGKLLLWHGWLDGLISPQNTIDYYNDVLATVGTAQARDSVRLFMSPGVNHCGGGEGPSEVDYLSVLEAWAEDGVVPERMITSKRLDDSGKLTRPLCAYPLVARYKGTGDTNDAANFDCD